MTPSTVNGAGRENRAQTPIDERARETYKQLRDTGLTDTDIMAFAGELLSLIALDVRNQAAAE